MTHGITTLNCELAHFDRSACHCKRWQEQLFPVVADLKNYNAIITC